MARRNSNILLRLTGDPSDAQAALRTVRNDLRRMSREEARIRLDVQTDRVKRQIQGVRNELEALSRKTSTPRVEAQTARATERLVLLELRLDRLNLKRVNIDVDVKRGALERSIAGIGSVERGVQGVSKGFAGIFQQIPLLGGALSGALSGAFSIASSLGEAVGGVVTRGITSLTGAFSQLGLLAGPIGSVVGSVVSLGASLAGLAAIAGGIVIALNAVLGAIVALGGALVALVASLGAAIAGLGALAVAAGAVLFPILIVGIGLFTRFAAVIKARQAREQELAQAVQQQKTAEEQRKTALENVRQAQQRLADTTVAARRAMAQAAIDQRHAELGLETSRNGVQNARLAVLQARKDLRDLLAQTGATGKGLDSLFKQFTDVHVDPTKLQGALGAGGAATGGKAVDPLQLAQAIQNVRNAELGVKQAVEGVGDAHRTALEAEKRRTDFARRGLRAYAPYRQALQQVATAEGRLAKAQTATSAAHSKYQRALAGLSTTERGTLSRLNELIDGFKRLAKAFTDPIFKAANETFDKLKGSGDGFRQALTEVGRAFGDVIRTIGAFLANPATQSAFKTMAAGAASLVRELGGKAFTSFLTIMTQVAVTALPAVESAARKVSGWLGRIAGQPAKIREATNGVIGHFKTWAGLAWQVLRAVAGIFRAAVGPGKQLAGSLTTIVRRFADWANSDEGQRKIHAFFVRMVRRAKEIVRWIKNAVVWLKNDLPKAAAEAKAAFEGVYQTVLKIQNAIHDIHQFLNDTGGRAQLINVDDKVKQVEDKRIPAQQRITLGLSLLELEISVKNRRKLEELLRKLGFKGKFPSFDTGGTVGGPTGAPRLAVVHGGEEIIKAAMAARFRPQLQAINAGATPAPQVVTAGGGDTHHHYHPPPAAAGNYPDGRSWMAHIRDLIELEG